MQQTTYNLKRIEPDDPFGPDTLNANTDAVAAQLARVDAALAAESAARETAVATEKSAREADAAAETARVNAAVAAKAPQTEITRLESAAATEKARVNGEISRIDTALAAKAAQTALTSLTQTVAANKTAADTALAARPRMVYGTYVGNGGSGASSPRALDFAATLGCAPRLLLVFSATDDFHLAVCQGVTRKAVVGQAMSHDYTNYFTWKGTGVSWYNLSGATSQMNQQNMTYHYVAFA